MSDATGSRRSGAQGASFMTPMPNTAPNGSATTAPRPKSMSFGSMNTAPPSSLTLAAEASQSSTENQTDHAGNSPSPAACAPQIMTPSTVKIADVSELASGSTPQP